MKWAAVKALITFFFVAALGGKVHDTNVRVRSLKRLHSSIAPDPPVVVVACPAAPPHGGIASCAMDSFATSYVCDYNEVCCPDGTCLNTTHATCQDGLCSSSSSGSDSITDSIGSSSSSSSSSSAGTPHCSGTWAINLRHIQCPSASGDPHLVNVKNEKFDIHDGVHRLIHYPRFASEREALLKVDVTAEMMGRSCYGVFIKSARVSGKWVGNDITLARHNSSGREAFGLNVGFHWLDYTTLKAGANFKGIMPVRLTASDRRAMANLPGGESIHVSIGQEDPTVLEFWVSHGSNELTQNKDVWYMNVQAIHLPKDIGGIIGLDKYVRPDGSKCGLVQEETDLLNHVKSMAMLQWQVSAPHGVD